MTADHRAFFKVPGSAKIDRLVNSIAHSIERLNVELEKRQDAPAGFNRTVADDLIILRQRMKHLTRPALRKAGYSPYI